MCVFGFNVAFKHQRLVTSRHCNGALTKSAATRECHAAATRHDTPPRHSIQTQSRPVAVLYIDAERHTGIQNYPF